jgi:hypothetical protein
MIAARRSRRRRASARGGSSRNSASNRRRRIFGSQTPYSAASVATNITKLTAGHGAADERGVHHSGDGGKSWRQAVGDAASPQHLRGLAQGR